MSGSVKGSIAILALAVIAGCGGDPYDRCIVNGEVRYMGRPIEHGQIRFMAMEGTQVPAAGAQIIDGKYTVDHQGGVPSGEYRVEFFEFQPHGGSVGMDGIVKQVLPEKFNRRSTMTLAVPPGGERITQDYDLK